MHTDEDQYIQHTKQQSVFFLFQLIENFVSNSEQVFDGGDRENENKESQVAKLSGVQGDLVVFLVTKNNLEVVPAKESHEQSINNEEP